jgi:hypothetical protein
VGFMLAILLLNTSCTRTVYIPTEKETIKYEIKTQHDSIFLGTTDSITTLIYKNGDSIFIQKDVIKWRVKDKVTLKIDTVYQEKTELQTIVKEVEKKIPAWKNYLMFAGGVFVLSFIYTVTVLGYRFFKK